MKEVQNIIKASEIAQATYIDIAADTNIIFLASQFTHLPLCISSIIPDQIYKCVDIGIEIVEIGNFDAYYNKGMIFNVKDIKNLSRTIRRRLPNIHLCVTLPYIISIKEQIELAKYLEFIGVNSIQIEGNINHRYDRLNQRLPLNRYNSTLINTYSLSRIVNIPIIAASGLNLSSAYIAQSYGASCIGIKTAIIQETTLNKKIDMIKKIKSTLKDTTTRSYIL
uniref:Uncharacterized protein ycf23 n=1 Tax=Compsopogon caeruleus TaxID=31354 RepID=A0A1Z1XBA1_9RHOD|nr:hypothetical protein [Compsopogon caeruleus]ARX96142.1 hypothetical protein [Compsopogon caeruleus]